MPIFRKDGKRGYSYRAFSKAAGFSSPNVLKLVIEGKRNIGPEAVENFITALGLSGVAVIGAADFRGEDGNSTDDWFVSSDGSVRGTAAMAVGCVVAPVHLPDGVTVNEVEFIFVDDSPGTFGITLRRTAPA